MNKSHVLIPDVQVKPGSDLRFLPAIGNFIVDKRPDTVINIGDFADMPSLSTYDYGKKEFEGRRYKDDIGATKEAQHMLLHPLYEHQKQQKNSKHKVYRPDLVLTLGNHENRINRAVSSDAKLEGLLKVEDLQYDKFGWKVYDYLVPVDIDGIKYAHYFTSGIMGNPAASAKALLRAECRSCVMGHVQKREVEVHPKTNYTAIFAGSCYLDKQDYLGPQGNSLIPGIWYFTNINNGLFDYQFISLESLMREYL